MALNKFVELLVAGLGGTANMVVATIYSLNCIIHDYKSQMSQEILAKLFESNCLLIRSKSRQIVEASLTLLKSLMAAFSQGTLVQFLPDLVSIPIVFY